MKLFSFIAVLENFGAMEPPLSFLASPGLLQKHACIYAGGSTCCGGRQAMQGAAYRGSLEQCVRRWAGYHDEAHTGRPSPYPCIAKLDWQPLSDRKIFKA